MSEIIQDPQGNDVQVFVRFHGEFVDAIMRADSKAAFETAAVGQDLMVQEVDEDGDTYLREAKGVNIDAIGPIVVTPGTYDEDGNELTAPVMDSRYHVNLRIAEPALSQLDEHGYPKWNGTAIAWTVYGEPDPEINAQEDGKKLNRVVLIDPATIKSPTRVWAGIA